MPTRPVGAVPAARQSGRKDGVTRILFARPTTIAVGSPGIAVVQEIEDVTTRRCRPLRPRQRAIGHGGRNDFRVPPG